jgi:hypothetical protein
LRETRSVTEYLYKESPVKYFQSVEREG